MSRAKEIFVRAEITLKKKPEVTKGSEHYMQTSLIAYSANIVAWILRRMTEREI